MTSSAPAGFVQARLERVRAAMQKRELDALVVYSAPFVLGYGTTTSGNVRYLADFASRFEPTLLVLPLASEPALVVYRAATNERWVRRKGVWLDDVRAVEDALAYGRTAREILSHREVRPDRIGVVGLSEMPVQTYMGITSGTPPFELVVADDLVNRLRAVKDDEEIQRHRVAARMSDAMLRAAMTATSVPGVQVFQLLAEMEHVGRSSGADQASGWISAGDEEFITVDVWLNRRGIEEGNRVAAGTFVSYDGYWAHSLRTWVKGRPSAKLREYFGIVREAHECGLQEVKPGSTLGKVIGAIGQTLSNRLPGREDFGARQAHGLGLVHSDPLGDDDQLEPGMVLTVHPSFSASGVGLVALGDVVLVTDGGRELLTRIPPDLALI